MLHSLVKTKTPSQSLTGKEIEVVFTKHLQRAWYLCQKVKMHCLMESLHQSEKVDISLTFHFSKNCWEKLNLCFCCYVELLSCVWLFATPWLCSPTGSSVHGISQARILEWVAISFSRDSSWPHTSCIGRHSVYHWDPWKVHTYPIIQEFHP